jgi:hypothetical protein
VSPTMGQATENVTVSMWGVCQDMSLCLCLFVCVCPEVCVCGCRSMFLEGVFASLCANVYL